MKDGKGRLTTLRDVTVLLAWAGLYIALRWRWLGHRDGPVLLPIMWTLYTLLSAIAVGMTIRDSRRDRRSRRRPDSSVDA